MRKGTWGLAFIAFVAPLVLGACGSSALRAAEQGDHAKLRAEIAQKHGRGKLSNGEAADLARAVAEREIVIAKDEKEALLRMKETRACSAELDDAFAERMKKHDGPGAAAALTRLEDGRLSHGTARDFLDDADDRWRAVGARTLYRDDDGKRRKGAMLDPSPNVRRSAIRASAQAKDASDLDVLFETARVDPELLLRSEALRAMSAIARSDAGKPRAADLAVRLRDLWTSGDDALREDVAVAWALSPVYENGGREALRVQIATGKGPGAIAAAGVVLRTGDGRDRELAASAGALLQRTIGEGSRRDRLHAIAVTKVEGLSVDALRKAGKEEDLDIRVPSLARLLESKPDRDAAQKELVGIASYGSRGAKASPGDKEDERMREHASRARLALAYAGELRIQAWIEEDLTSPDPHRRASAASALSALGRAARAAPLLADADASVRTRAACTLLVAGRR